jgi:transcriptional regulator with XRE-family HTH domain
MSEQDLREIRAFLKEALQASRKTTRVLERALGIGSGKLQALLDGSLDLRVRHLLAIAEVLSIPPEDLLAFTCREAREGAKYRATDWLPHLRPREEGQPLPKNLNQLKELIRAAVQEELDERGLSGNEARSRSRRTGAR